MKKAVYVYALVVGLGMLCMWLFFIFSGNVPEFEIRPAEIVYHLTAEFATAALLIAAAVISLKKLPAGRPLLLSGLGMLLYTVIVSPGYYAQRGEVAFVVMFSVLTVLTIAAGAVLIADIRKDSVKQE